MSGRGATSPPLHCVRLSAEAPPSYGPVYRQMLHLPDSPQATSLHQELSAAKLPR